MAFSQQLQVELYYRWGLVQSFFGVAVGLVGMLLFWLAAGRSPQAGAVYPVGMLVAYFIVAAAQSLINDNQLSFNLSTSIRMGKLSAQLLRPYPYLLGVVAQAAAQALVRSVLVVPIMVVICLTSEPLRAVATALTSERLLLYLAALGIGLCAGWLIRIALGLLAFDLTQTWGPELIYLAIYSVASGLGYPADLLPPSLLAIVQWTPVYYMIAFPALVLLGRIDAASAGPGLLRGASVVALTAILVTFMWRRGTRRFEAVGI
jgi:ABC-type uncharacterized transport system permease subunit